MNFERTTKYIEENVINAGYKYFSILVKQHGKKVFDYFYATDDKDNKLLRMYSLSKPITVVAFMQLVEKGLVSVDDRVSKYIDGYDNVCLLNGQKVQAPILIKHLLTMTSGLDYNRERAAIKKLVKDNPNASTIDVCSKFAIDGINDEPGKTFIYSLSIDVIAAIIEKVTGEKFSSYVEKNVLNQLGLKSTTFRHDLELANQARAEYMPKDGSFVKTQDWYECFFPSKAYESGGAGLISTVEDYSTFIDSLATRSNKIINDKTVDEIATIRVPSTPFNGPNEYSKNNVDYGYGYGVRVRKNDSSSGIAKGEFGWDGATGSYCLCDRTNGVSIVIGLTIQYWPSATNGLHLNLAHQVYKDLGIKE